MPAKAYSNTASAKRSRAWYQNNKTKKINYEKARKDEHLARYYARKKMGNPKGVDIDHIKPLGKGGSNAKSNLRIVRKDHSKLHGKKI